MKARIAVAAAIMAAPSVAVAQSRDALTVDPEHHQVIFENDFVRVMRGMAGAGARSALHTHPATVVVSLGSVRARQNFTGAPGPQIMDFTPGQVAFSPAFEHSWEVMSGAVNVVGVELKRPAPASVPALPATDAVTVDPAVHHVVTENAHVRVFQVLASDGARSPMHSHSRGMVLISSGRARLRLTNQDGSAAVLDFHPGQAIWIDPGAVHSWQLLAGALQLTVVEVKATQR